MVSAEQSSGVDVSALIPDYSREYKAWFEWVPPRSLLASIRSYQRNAVKRNLIGSTFKKIAVIRHRFWSIVTGADIPLNCQLGGGLLIPHPNGIVIHPEAVIGVNCLILQQVTIGYRTGGVPVIGGHVDIGSGAKVLGKISVGDHAIIGANAVVVKNVPSGSTAVGVPAVLIK
jgi:serine O-acetyltransferase